MKKKLVILSGPSCVGKGPLRVALRRYHPEIPFAEPINCHSRRPRLKKASGQYEIHGIDYYFLPRGQFSQLNPEHFLTIKIRSEYQALDLSQIEDLFERYSVVLIEAYPTIAIRLKEWAENRWSPDDVKVVRVFISPLSPKDAADEQTVYEIMRRKLLRRGEDDPEKIEERARSAFREIQQAVFYDNIIVNPIGEDDIIGWGEPLSPEARNTLEEFVKILISD